VETLATRYAGHATILASNAAAREIEMVLAIGGDGTLGEIAEGLAHTNTFMAPLPGGTGNSLAKELHLPLRKWLRPGGMLRACEALEKGRVQSMDLGRTAMGEWWLQWTGAGMDGFIVESIEPRSRLTRRLGTLGYLSKGLPAIPRFPGMHAQVTVDGRTYSGEYMMVTISNCRRYAGGQYELNPHAVLDDGYFDIWFFRAGSTLKFFNYLHQVAKGKHLSSPDISCVRGKTVKIVSDPPISVHHDGDPAGTTPIHCTLEPGALMMLVPETAPEGLFQKKGQPLL
jgi:YegS/Rv2252/BmrU family lipid kinase